MASKRTPFQGEAWTDKTGTTFELEHNGQLARVRFRNDGHMYFFTDRGPLGISYVITGDGRTDVHVQPRGKPS